MHAPTLHRRRNLGIAGLLQDDVPQAYVQAIAEHVGTQLTMSSDRPARASRARPFDTHRCPRLAWDPAQPGVHVDIRARSELSPRPAGADPARCRAHVLGSKGCCILCSIPRYRGTIQSLPRVERRLAHGTLRTESDAMNTLTVADVMTHEVLAVAPDTSRESAARMLATRHITGAPVIDRDRRVVGVVSLHDLVDPDRDEAGDGYPVFYRILDGWAVELGDAADVGVGRVDEVMTRATITTTPQTPVLQAAKTMLSNGIHRLVVTQSGVLAGIVTTTDLLRAFVNDATERMA
ncbi:MAG: CBS domain-containing protein [Myxococcales bacterium FL481]|nr:MAG: CBS domain-containing protein [Myxococcales bacterium FL481]